MGMCSGAHVCMCAHVWKPEVMAGSLLHSFFFLVLEAGSLLEPGAHQPVSSRGPLASISPTLGL